MFSLSTRFFISITFVVVRINPPNDLMTDFGLKRIFFKGIKHGGKIPLARVGKQNNDTLPLVLRALKK